MILLPLFFSDVLGFVIELTKQDVFGELLYADDFILMSETIEGLMNKFVKWEEAFER